MAAPGFYDDRDAAQPLIDRHQTLMWEVGDSDASVGRAADGGLTGIVLLITIM